LAADSTITAGGSGVAVAAGVDGTVGAGVLVGAGCVGLADAVALEVAFDWTVDDTVCVGDAVGDEVAEATRVGVIITSVAGAPPAMAALATISPVN
jgi:hypothetical protein